MKLNRGEPDHSHWKTPFTPKQKATAWLGLGACLVMAGVLEWTNPPNPPFTGRWSWLKAAAFDAFGIHGVAILWLAVGVLFVVGGFLQWPRAR